MEHSFIVHLFEIITVDDIFIMTEYIIDSMSIEYMSCGCMYLFFWKKKSKIYLFF
jgi:hypothetical protein